MGVPPCHIALAPYVISDQLLRIRPLPLTFHLSRLTFPERRGAFPRRKGYSSAQWSHRLLACLLTFRTDHSARPMISG